MDTSKHPVTQTILPKVELNPGLADRLLLNRQHCSWQHEKKLWGWRYSKRPTEPSKKTRVQFLTTMWATTPLIVIPAPSNVVYPWGLHGHLYSHAQIYTCIYITKNKTFLKNKELIIYTTELPMLVSKLSLPSTPTPVSWYRVLSQGVYHIPGYNSRPHLYFFLIQHFIFSR